MHSDLHAAQKAEFSASGHISTKLSTYLDWHAITNVNFFLPSVKNERDQHGMTVAFAELAAVSRRHKP